MSAQKTTRHSALRNESTISAQSIHQHQTPSRPFSLRLDGTIDCIPRRAQGFHASWEGFIIRMKISITHPKDFVYCATWEIRGEAREPRGHAREPSARTTTIFVARAHLWLACLGWVGREIVRQKLQRRCNAVTMPLQLLRSF